MNTLKIIFAVIFILSLSLNVAFLLYFPASPPTRSEETQSLSSLNLTGEQKKLMAPVRAKLHRENQAIKKQIRGYREKLLAALDAEKVDRETINHCLANISALQEKIQQNTVEEIIAIREYMNPQQCRCLIEDLASTMDRASKPCDCPLCKAQKK